MQNFFKRLLSPFIIKLGKQIEQKQFADKPIVIGACPRSGTTILLAILGAHPNIFAIPNQTYAFDRWEEYFSPGDNKIHYRPTRIDRLYREFLFNRIPKKATRWLEKTPKHIRSFYKILDYFGDRVLLINVVRDGRDVITSKHPKHTPDQYWVSIQRWLEDTTTGLDLKNHPQVLTLRYEDLVVDFEKTMNLVYTFIQEPVPADLDKWIAKTNIKRSKHWEKPVQNLYHDAIERWKKPEHKNRINEFMKNQQAVKLLQELKYI